MTESHCTGDGNNVVGRPPDFIAFGITLVMTFVLALGASKSVLFNNVLNTVNLASWVFILTAGMFYVDTTTWSEHEGFLPFGWSGVSAEVSSFFGFYFQCKCSKRLSISLQDSKLYDAI